MVHGVSIYTVQANKFYFLLHGNSHVPFCLFLMSLFMNGSMSMPGGQTPQNLTGKLNNTCSVLLKLPSKIAFFYTYTSQT